MDTCSCAPFSSMLDQEAWKGNFSLDIWSNHWWSINVLCWECFVTCTFLNPNMLLWCLDVHWTTTLWEKKHLFHFHFLCHQLVPAPKCKVCLLSMLTALVHITMTSEIKSWLLNNNLLIWKSSMLAENKLCTVRYAPPYAPSPWWCPPHSWCRPPLALPNTLMWFS